MREYQEEINRLRKIIETGKLTQSPDAPISPGAEKKHQKNRLSFDGVSVKVVSGDDTASSEELTRQIQASEDDQARMSEEKLQAEVRLRELEEAMTIERQTREQLAMQLQDKTNESKELAAQRAQVEQQLAAKIEEERNRAKHLEQLMSQELKHRQDLAKNLAESHRRAQEEKDTLQAKLKALESQLLVGNKTLLDEQEKVQAELRKNQVRLQQEQLEKSRLEEERRRAEEAKVCLP